MDYPTPYRKDIDGLRAISVLAVLFYHYRIPGFGGGFVGVDVFFVISGYLIGGHIIDEIAAGRFSLLAFYERRVRRIFPALFAMLAAVFCAALLVLYPIDFREFAVTGINVTLFLSNLRFYWDINGYTDTVAHQTPLLHTWSLGVEEQYYLIFPLLMIAISRFGQRRCFQLLLPLALGSFLICIAMVRLEASAAFFLPQYRFWELLLGAMLAAKWPSTAPIAPTKAFLAPMGIGMILASIILFSEKTLFPSEYALIPCVGAMLVLYTNCQSGLVGTFLRNGAMTRIGQWSYSIYLLHWPLLVLVQYFAFTPLSFPVRVVLLAITIPLGMLSWRFVEQPFRKRSFLPDRRKLFFVGAAVGVTLALVFWAGTFDEGLEGRFPPSVRRVFVGYTSQQLKCSGSAPDEDAERCKMGEATAPARTLLWGDSHALALMPALDAAFSQHNDAAYLAEKSGCPPLAGVEIDLFHLAFGPRTVRWMNQMGIRDRPSCQNFDDRVLRWLAANPPQSVILAGRWAAYIDNSGKAPDDGSAKVLSDSETLRGTPELNGDVFQRGMSRTLAALTALHVRIFVVESVPEMTTSVPYAMAAENRLGRKLEVRLQRSIYDQRQVKIRSIFAALAKRYPFTVIHPEDQLCDAAYCAAMQNGLPLYMDSNHLSRWGAKLVEPALTPIWENQKRSEP